VRIPRNVMYHKNLKAEVFSRESVFAPMNLAPNPKLIERAARLLVEATSPLLYVGSEVWTTGAAAKCSETPLSDKLPACRIHSVRRIRGSTTSWQLVGHLLRNQAWNNEIYEAGSQSWRS
jgi:thiamine pyrophosphate-dependent acetolactate synthase large subunit-like protein